MIPRVPEVFVTRSALPVMRFFAPVPVGYSHTTVDSAQQVFKLNQKPPAGAREERCEEVWLDP